MQTGVFAERAISLSAITISTIKNHVRKLTPPFLKIYNKKCFSLDQFVEYCLTFHDGTLIGNKLYYRQIKKKGRQPRLENGCKTKMS